MGSSLFETEIEISINKYNKKCTTLLQL